MNILCSLYFLIGSSGHLLSLSRTTTICFSANAALENLRISSFDFQIQTLPNSFLGRKKLLRNVGTGCKGSSIYCSSSGDGAKEGKIIASWGENLFWFGWQISFRKMGIDFLGSSIFSVNFHFPKSVYFLSSSLAAAGLFPCTWNVWVWWWGKRGRRVLGGAWAPANSRIYFSLARGRWDNTGKPQGTSPSLHIFIFQSILFGKSSSGKERAAGKKGIRELQRTLSFKKYFLVMTITILFFITKNIIIKSHHGLRKRRIPWVRWSPGLEGRGEDLSLLLLLRGPLHSDKTTLCSKPPPPVYDSMMQNIKN